MREPLWERIKQFVCRYIGHKLEGESWVHEGFTHDCCKRCRRIISIKKEATQ